MVLLGKKPILTGGLLAVSGLVAGFAFNKKYSPAVWSIHVRKTNAPLTSPEQTVDWLAPAVKPEDVTDVDAAFVADPFLMHDHNGYYLFFEVLNRKTNRGEIGLALSDEGEKWTYDGIVLNEEFHLSYPHVIKQGNEYYMVPESVEAGGIYLYKATEFPYKWERNKQLAAGSYTDATLFQHADKWWMFAAGLDNETLHLFWAEELEGEWKPHVCSPLITNDKSNSRPARRVAVENDKLYRYAQDDGPYYGHSVKAFHITKLSESVYEEKEIGMVLAGSGIDGDWRRDGMHHIDQLQLEDGHWLEAVDGHWFNHQNYMLWKARSLFQSGGV